MKTCETLLSEIKARLSKASLGPWKIGYNDGSGKFDAEEDKFCLVSSALENDDVGDGSLGAVLHAKLCENEEDAEFIAHSRTDLETLVAMVDVARKSLLDIREQLNSDGLPTIENVALAELDRLVDGD